MWDDPGPNSYRYDVGGYMIKNGQVTVTVNEQQGWDSIAKDVGVGTYTPSKKLTRQEIGIPSFYSWGQRRPVGVPYATRIKSSKRRYSTVDLNKTKKEFIKQWGTAQRSGDWSKVEKDYGVSVSQRDRFTSGKRAYDVMAGKYNAPKRDEKTGLLSVGNFIDPFTGLGRNPTNRLKGIDIFQEANYDKKKRTHTFINPFNLR